MGIVYSSHNLGSQQTSGKILRTVVDEATDLEPGGGLLFLIRPHRIGQILPGQEIARSLPGWSGIRVSALSWHADNEGDLLSHILNRAENREAIDSLTELVDREGARTAIIIDDAHWADVTSLRALVEATRRLREGRVAVILTASDKVDASEDLPMTRLREMADHAVTLAPLDVEDVSALALSSIGAHLSPLAAAELRDLTGGRPGRIQEVLQAAPADHWRLSNPQIPVPKPWRAALERRTRGLEVDAVLAAVAILPGTGTAAGPHPFLADDLDGSLRRRRRRRPPRTTAQRRRPVIRFTHPPTAPSSAPPPASRGHRLHAARPVPPGAEQHRLRPDP